MNQPSQIKPLAPKICPQCGGEKTFGISEDSIACRRCGYMMRKPDGYALKPADTLPKKPKQTQADSASNRKRVPPSYGRSHMGEISRWASAAYDSAILHARREEWDEALKAAYRALGSQRDFLDAHLLIGYLEDDPEKKRKHLSYVLGLQPNHGGAMRELMVLNGDITPEEAEALENPYLQPEMREAGGAVRLTTENLRCPTCGSTGMTVDEITGLVTCGSCGSVDKNAGKREVAAVGGLTQALLKRRVQPVQWIVGEHLLVCDSCGAQRTIPARKMSEECPFCGSNHIVEKDALGSFQQPDGLLPFIISRTQAKESIKEKLGGFRERMKGWFDNNTVERESIEGVYLPYWTFDASLSIRRTIIRDMPGSDYDRERQRLQQLPPYQSYTVPDAMHDVQVCAVESPPKLLTTRLGSYSLNDLRDYDPKLLAKFPAELYSIDFDEASLQAREQISKAMRQKHAQANEYGVKVSVFSSVTGMTFQLLLVPVWVGTLHEEDGDVRTALVNGQTGKVVLGKAHKPRY